MIRRLLGLAGAVLLLAACAVQRAETPEQRAYALYATFVIAQEAAADLVENPATPAAVVAAIKAAHGPARVAVHAARDAARTYSAAKATQNGNVAAALAALEAALRSAAPKVEALRALVPQT